VIPVKDENAFPLTYASPTSGEEKKKRGPLPPRARKKRNNASHTKRRGKKLVPSPLMGEGQDEGERGEFRLLLKIRNSDGIIFFA